MIILDGWQFGYDADIDVITYPMGGFNSAVAISIDKSYYVKDKIRLCMLNIIASVCQNNSKDKDFELLSKIEAFVIYSEGNPSHHRIYELPAYSFNVGKLKQDLKNTLLKCDGVKFITEEMKLLL